MCPTVLEYGLVHELVHLLERHHSDRVQTDMDQLLAHWQQYRDRLNQAPLDHEIWVR